MTPRGRARALALAVLAAAVPRVSAAEPISILSESFFVPARAAMVPGIRETQDQDQRAAGPSLFSGREGASLFAARTPREEMPARKARAGTAPLAVTPTATPAAIAPPGPHARHAERIRHLIGYAEAGRQGYDAIQHGATRLPAKRPTDLTIAEIFRWVADTPGQQHAIGRYQFIPATLRRLVSVLGIEETAVFSPRLQDRLADRLLEEAGLSSLRAGGMNRHQYMNNLAQIWAGLPTSSGKSHYHGFAGNRATMTWARFDAEMAKIFPG
jgi:hypothetical protein